MRVVVMADIHANILALQAVWERTRKWCDAYWVLGDLIGYGPDPLACIELLREIEQEGRLLWRAGNHDLAAYGQGVRPSDLNTSNGACQTVIQHTRLMEDAPELHHWHKDHSSLAHAAPMLHKSAGLTALLVHASPNEDGHFLTYEKVEKERCVNLSSALESLRSASHQNRRRPAEPVCAFVGHTHLPALVWAADASISPESICMARTAAFAQGEAQELRPAYYLINPGSVGLPLDGDPRASYVMLDLGSGMMQIRREAYDVAETLRRSAAKSYCPEVRQHLDCQLGIKQGGIGCETKALLERG